MRLLKESGVQIVMLTGDNSVTANSVAKALALDGVKAGVLPEDKYKHLQELQAHGHVVAMAANWTSSLASGASRSPSVHR